MRLKVDLLPKGPYQGVVLLIDVLRATTTVPLLFEHGVGCVYLTPSVAAARNYAKPAGHVLIGERGGMPPEGFHHGASPANVPRLELNNRDVVMTTQNGPKALQHVADAPAVLLASFVNARAACDATLRLALQLGTQEIAVVCAGQDGNESLDDTLVAGFLTRRLQRLYQDAQHQTPTLAPLELHDAAKMVTALLRAFPDPQEALLQSTAGEILSKLGLQEDIAHASLISQTDAVPHLVATIPFEPAPLYRFEQYRFERLESPEKPQP